MTNTPASTTPPLDSVAASATFAPRALAPRMLFDMHCHLDFAPNAPDIATQAEALDLHALSATVTPAEYEKALTILEGASNVRTGLGLHPWWIADGRCGEEAIVLFEQLAPTTRWIGEVGLDFAGERGKGSAHQAQLEALDRVLFACNQQDTANSIDDVDPTSAAIPSPPQPPGATPSAAAPFEAREQNWPQDGGDLTTKLISLHAVRSASEILDALERHDTLVRHRCVFHWFSGSSDELTCAIRAGCYFSVNARMLATKRGRAYARAIPEDHLLLETDLPAREGDTWSAQTWKAQLEETLALLAETRSVDPARLAETLARTSAQLLGTA